MQKRNLKLGNLINPLAPGLPGGGGPDTIAPLVSSMTALDPTTIRVVFDEAMIGPSASGWQFNPGAKNATSVTTVDNFTYDFNFTSAFASTEGISYTYDGSGSWADIAGNFLAAITVTNAARLTPFDNAYGWGRYTRGAMAHPGPKSDIQIFNPTDEASLRTAWESNQPAFILPINGGLLNLASGLGMESPYKTMAFQVAPGDGMVLAGQTLQINRSECIIRGLRFRRQDVANGTADGLQIRSTNNSGVITNVMFDHISAAEAGDENITSFGSPDFIENWTVQRCISAYPLNDANHGMGMLFNKSGTHNCASILNAFFHTRERSPKFARSLRFVSYNNYAYNYERKGHDIGPYVSGNVQGNAGRRGLDFSGPFGAVVLTGDHDHLPWSDTTTYSTNPGQPTTNEIVSHAGILWQNRTHNNLDNEPGVTGDWSAVPADITLALPTQVYLNDNLEDGNPVTVTFENSANAARIVGTPFAYDVGYTPIAASLIESMMLSTTVLNCGAPNRDFIDDQAIQSGINGTGNHIDVVFNLTGQYTDPNNTVYQDHVFGVWTQWLVDNNHAANIAAAQAFTKDMLLAPSPTTGRAIIEDFINDPIHFVV